MSQEIPEEQTEEVLEEELNIDEESSVSEEAEVETGELGFSLEQINLMISVTEIWDSIIEGKISIDDAKNRLMVITRRVTRSTTKKPTSKKPRSKKSSKKSKKEKSRKTQKKKKSRK